MHLQIAKWGNSLSLRIPAEYVRKLGIKEGDKVEISMTVDGGFTVRPSKWNRKAFSAEIKAMCDAMPIGESVIQEMRRGARY